MTTPTTKTLLTTHLTDHPSARHQRQLAHIPSIYTLDFAYQLRAVYLDLDTNATLTYLLTSSSSSSSSIEIMQKFFVNPLSGLIELTSRLDYATKRSFDLHITCTDHGIPQRLNTSITLTVTVTIRTQSSF